MASCLFTLTGFASSELSGLIRSSLRDVGLALKIGRVLSVRNA